MFGYVRPLRPELKCKEWDLYQATYCGLCGTLRQRYGMLAPMFLSYDLTFLALLLEEPDEHFVSCKGRCHGNLLLKKPRAQSSDSLAYCADLTVILTWFQLQDKVADSGFWKGLPSRMLSVFLKRSHRKALEYESGFETITAEALARLHQLESEECASMDQVADCFALILESAGEIPEQPEKTLCLKQLLYHVGRWIYLIDARDDLEEDKKEGSYNPLRLRYGEQCDDEALAVSLGHSLYLAQTALQLVDLKVRHGVVENILYYGMPTIQEAVLSGAWQEMKKQKIWRKRL